MQQARTDEPTLAASPRRQQRVAQPSACCLSVVLQHVLYADAAPYRRRPSLLYRLKGMAKEVMGKVTDRDDLRSEGEAQQDKGDA
jgi:hypothetical protein